MYKYNKSQIMKKAWEGFRRERQYNPNYTFADALRGAWLSAKWERKEALEAAKAPKDTIINGWNITKLEKAGGKRWTKYGKDRMYLRNVGNDLLGIKLFYNYRRSSSWSNATLNGEDISNGWACTIMGTYSDAYIDLTTGEICDCGTRAGMQEEFENKLTKKFAA